ncbi:hypothetical protein [Millisia brevis]|uniref:hypothetical protein n=1 Tax=Millisia brevis TaxID=264148 RepID=UPI000835BDEE|nr:hypothetical protein [Millisia brevis]
MSVTFDRTQQNPNYPSRPGSRSAPADESPTEVLDRVVAAPAERALDLPAEQALDLPGEEPARLRASRAALIGMWTIALVVTVGYIGMPLTMFLTPILGSSMPAMAVAVGVIVIGSLALRLILRAILTERRASAPRHDVEAARRSLASRRTRQRAHRPAEAAR